jgi:hypothetical protein
VRRGSDDQPFASLATQHSRQCRKQRPVSVIQARPLRRAAQHSNLVAQDHELGLPLKFLTAQMEQDPQNRAKRQVDESESQHRGILADPAEAPTRPKSEFWYPWQRSRTLALSAPQQHRQLTHRTLRRIRHTNPAVTRRHARGTVTDLFAR